MNVAFSTWQCYDDGVNTATWEHYGGPLGEQTEYVCQLLAELDEQAASHHGRMLVEIIGCNFDSLTLNVSTLS